MKYLLAVTLSLFVSAAHANDQDDPVTMNTCLEVYGLAKAIMNARQVGMPMNELVKVLNETDTGMPRANALAIAMVTSAYREPQFNSPNNQGKATAKFSSDILTTCITEWVD